MRKLVILIFVLLTSLISLVSTSAAAEPLWIFPREKFFFEEPISARIGIENPMLQIELAPLKQELGSQKIRLRPNAPQKFGFGADYSFLGFYLSVLKLDPPEDVKTHGTTDSFDFSFHIYLKRLVIDLYYQWFAGYGSQLYNYQKDGARKHWVESDRSIRSDVRSSNYGFNLFHVYKSDRMSFPSTFANTSIERHSGGSVFSGVSYLRQNLRSDRSLVPSDAATDFGRLKQLQESHFDSFPLGGGYAYNYFATERWFMAGSIYGGIGPQHQQSDWFDGTTTNKWAGMFKANLRLAGGFNSESLFGGLHIIGDASAYYIDSHSLTLSSIYAGTYFGFRF